MDNIYDTLKDFNSPDGVLSTSPFWILCVVSFQNQITFSRSDADYRVSVTSNPAPNTNGLTVGEAMTTYTTIITSDCVSMNTSTEKGAHLSNLQATLLPNLDYMNIVFPGDWVMGWMMNDQQTFDSVLARLKKGKEACNVFMDGLKFVGRVQSLRKAVSIEPSNGIKTTRYLLNGTGFQELDSFFFYDPQLAVAYPSWGIFLATANSFMQSVLSSNEITSDVMIPALFKLLLGRGTDPALANPIGLTSLPTAPGSAATETSPFAYLVPTTIGTILGKTNQINLLSYADIIEMVIGVQRYSSSYVDAGDLRVFLPDGIQDELGNIKHVGLPLVGIFNADTPQFINKTIWTIINQFMNNTINEMFTCLRVNAEGNVVPQVVVRQMPFSGPERSLKDPKLTPYRDIPRWRIAPELIYRYDLGRSDTLRTNFLHFAGQSPITSALMATQLARSGVYLDEHDIKRNGLRMDMQTISSAVSDQASGPQRWMEIRADYVIDQQLTLTGTFTLVGIQAPICEGDNIEFENQIFHIESVSHSVAIDQNGTKGFSTSLRVTHGTPVGNNKFEPNNSVWALDANGIMISPPNAVTSENNYG